jgi:hypothetical protein
MNTTHPDQATEKNDSNTSTSGNWMKHAIINRQIKMTTRPTLARQCLQDKGLHQQHNTFTKPSTKQHLQKTYALIEKHRLWQGYHSPLSIREHNDPLIRNHVITK